MSQYRRLLGCALLTVCPVAACTLITHFDDVVTTKPGAGGSAGAGGANNGGHVATGGTTADGEAGENAGGAAPSAPMHGVLAVAGTDPSKADANVVSLIDPTTGAEFARQTLIGA